MTARDFEYVSLDSLKPTEGNPKDHDLDGIKASMREFGFLEPFLLDDRTGGSVVAGHGRREALQDMRARLEPPPEGVEVVDGDWLVPVVTGFTSRSDDHAKAAVIALNRLTERGGWNPVGLQTWLDQLEASSPELMDLVRFSDEDMAALLSATQPDLDVDDAGEDEVWEDQQATLAEAEAAEDPDAPRPTLADRFLIPPFDVLDARSGWWQARKKRWIGLGIRSELGRVRSDEDRSNLLGLSAVGRDPDYLRQMHAKEAELGRTLTREEFDRDHYVPPAGDRLSGTSIFDPVLCELIYRWFSAPGMTVLDPFAGGSVRGLMAALLDRHYVGNDLAADQIKANQDQGEDFTARNLIQPGLITWTTGDSAKWVQTLDPQTADLIFTCPPYLWLEKYSDDPDDLSTMTTDQFEDLYGIILRGAARALRKDRFAVVVVGDVRDPKTGRLVDLRGMTIRVCADAGLHLASAAVLVTPVGSVAVRTPRTFPATRVLGRTHQDCLVFCKGDRGAAATALGDVDVTVPDGLLDGEEGSDVNGEPVSP